MMADKYYLEGSSPFSYIRDRDDNEFMCTISSYSRMEIDPNTVVDLMNKAYLKGGELSSVSGSSFELEELKLKNKYLEEQNQYLKKKFNDFEKALDFAYRASNLLKEMGHRHVRKYYGLSSTEENKITVEKQKDIFGESFTIKKGDMVYGMIKDVDEDIINKYITPLLNYFYDEGKNDNDR